MGPENKPEIFTPDNVDSINGYQHCGMWHPFTCGNNHDGERVLVATVTGMNCPTCDYTQDWCHRFMIDWTWKKQVEASPLHAVLAAKRVAKAENILRDIDKIKRLDGDGK